MFVSGVHCENECYFMISKVQTGVEDLKFFMLYYLILKGVACSFKSQRESSKEILLMFFLENESGELPDPSQKFSYSP